MSNQKPEQKSDATTHSAMKKVGAKKENDICRYIPGSKGGYIHHFSLRKMKNENPEEYVRIITKHIIQPANPTKLPPNPRAPRGSRKRRDPLPLSKQDIDLLLNFARQSGRGDIIRKLAPRRDLKAVKRELISSIKKGEVKEELWLAYVESVAAPTPSTHQTQTQHAFAGSFN